MIVTSPLEFQNAVLNKLSFKPFFKDHYTLYKNPYNQSSGYYIKYSRKDYYDLGIADYTIPKDFSISFNNPSPIIRFGTVYSGITEFEIEDNPNSSFSPSSFFVLEKDIKGTQKWRKGTHYHGVEITIYNSYIEKVINKIFPNMIDLNSFVKNYTYKYIPLEIDTILKNLLVLSETNSLNIIYLESKILECIAIISNIINSSPENSFTSQINYGDIIIGKNRFIPLTISDINAIQKAHYILSQNPKNPPTIKNLSKLVFLNEQKLKAGFSKHYHMSIGKYVTSLKMTIGANLLSTTNLSIEEISKETGYLYSANFSKMFKKFYGKTPLNFRKNKKDNI